MSALYNLFKGRALSSIRIIITLLILVPLSSITHSETTERFTKLDDAGEALPLDAKKWACVADNRTGLIWEKRDPSSALHDHDTYIWYQPEAEVTGSERAYESEDWADNTCFGFDANDPANYCNTKAYADRVNQSRYCGFDDWRLPSVTELLSLRDRAIKSHPDSSGLNVEMFPFHKPFVFWTSSTNDSGTVLTVFGDDRVLENSERSDSISLRLVRERQD